MKRGVDVFIAATGLAVLAPVLFALAVAIRIETPGGAFFRQERLGRGGVRFRIWKLRTMVKDAPVVIDDDGTVVNAADDARHTRLGRVLRAWSLDELPQLLNVLVGEMSVVGPRPDLPGALDLYTPHQRRKLEVRPGITGLAQVKGRNALSRTEKWNFDAQYAERAGLLTDVKLIAETVQLVVMRKSVYSRSSPRAGL